MQWTVRRPVVVQSVLPAAIKVTGLTLAILDVLAEIDTFLGRDIKTNRLSQIIEGYLAILVRIKPVKEITDVLFGCNIPPSVHQLLEARVLYIVFCWHAPLIEDTLKCSILIECSLDQLFFQVVTSHLLTDALLIWLVLLNALPEIYFELGVLLGVMSEEKCFCWLDAVAQPSTEVIVVDACF